MTLTHEFREPALFGKRSEQEQAEFKDLLSKSRIEGILICAAPASPKEKRYIPSLRPVAPDVYMPDIYYDRHLQSIKYSFDDARSFGSDFLLVFANMWILGTQHWGFEGASPCSLYDTSSIKQARAERISREETQTQRLIMALETRKDFHAQLRNENGPYISPLRAVEHPFLSKKIFPDKIAAPVRAVKPA